MKTYNITLNPENPELTIRLPLDIIKDLVQRATDNGRDITVEMMIRLARSLENNLAMEENDRLLAAECYFANNR